MLLQSVISIVKRCCLPSMVAVTFLAFLNLQHANAELAQEAYVKGSSNSVRGQFGFSVDVSGDTMIVGAMGAGAAYVFVRNGTNWSQQAVLKTTNSATFDASGQYGWAVAVSGDTAVVGARVRGAAYVFAREGTNWSQQAYLKAANARPNDFFGVSVAISGDTIVIGASLESSASTGVNNDGANNSAPASGAAYVFVRNGTNWSQQAYLKASNTGIEDGFGHEVAISGGTIAVSALYEESNATGVNGNQNDNSVPNAGAAYVFVRSGTNWTQQAYLKASNTGVGNGFVPDYFGASVSISGDTVAVSAIGEDSNAVGVNGDQNNNTGSDSGAVYVFARNGTNWSQQAYLKQSNTDGGDLTGYGVSVSGDTLVVGARGESSSAVGVDGNQADNSRGGAGAAYLFVRTGTSWRQQHYLKASNPDAGDNFGFAVAVSGHTVVLGSPFEASNATGVNGNQSDNSVSSAGAVYVFEGLEPLSPPQERTETLIPFSGHSWRFNDSGTDLGEAWRTNDFDDTGWSVGEGLFGVETNSPFPYLPYFSQITTPMMFTPSPNTITSYYFRTWFYLDPTNLSPGLVLVSTNLVDDGAVIFLNGNEVARFRVPTNQMASTPATFQQSEGTNEVAVLDGSFLRGGSNLLAVELHQNLINSSDIVWGHTLAAITFVPLAITNEPSSYAKAVEDTVTFTVGVSGGPVIYFWQKESPTNAGTWLVPVPKPPSLPSYTIPNLQLSNSGNYRVIVSNYFGSVTSMVAQLTVSETPLTITNQPASQTLAHDAALLLTVGVSGRPVTYAWQKESVPNSGNWTAPNPASSNMPAYYVPNARTNHSGRYRVIVSNSTGAATSTVAQVTVYPDANGPRALWAVPSLFGGRTNRINVRFSELLNSGTTHATNFQVYSLSRSEAVGITSTVYSAGNVLLNLITNNFYLEVTNQYVVTINRVRDPANNVIAPNTQVAVQWTNLNPAAPVWSLPPEPEPILLVTPLGTNRDQFSWTGHGYALEFATNLPPTPGLPAFLYWFEPTNMSNPFLYTNNSAVPQRYFRLRK